MRRIRRQPVRVLAGQPDRLEATLMGIPKFNESQSIAYNYEVGYLEGLQRALMLLHCNCSECRSILFKAYREQIDAAEAERVERI